MISRPAGLRREDSSSTSPPDAPLAAFGGAENAIAEYSSLYSSQQGTPVMPSRHAGASAMAASGGSGASAASRSAAGDGGFSR